MALFDRPLESINEGDLISLVENQVRESYQIEYKRAVAFKEKQDKLDFLAAVTSFANTVGGDLLIGVIAESGIPISVPGWEGVDVDREKQRIENLLRDQVEPRFGLRIHEVSLPSANPVVVIRVPWSWAQPHMVRMDQVNRFYYRHSAGKDIMNVSQIRAAFALSSSLEDQISEFRHDRVELIKTGHGTLLTPGFRPTMVIHIVPFESFRSGFKLDLEAAMNLANQGLLPPGSGANWYGFNLDGIYCVDSSNQCDGYSLLFRNGIIEAADRKLLAPHDKQLLIPGGAVPRVLFRHLTSSLQLLRGLGMLPPAVLMVTFTGAQGYSLATKTEFGVGYYQRPIDRADLWLPEVLMDDFDQAPAEICRPILDALWNAAGLASWSE